MRLYCYDGEVAGDAHAVQIELSADDVQRIGDVRAKERPGRYKVGKYVRVTDQATGQDYEVASAPCGAGCHCAAVARKVEAN